MNTCTNCAVTVCCRSCATIRVSTQLIIAAYLERSTNESTVHTVPEYNQKHALRRRRRWSADRNRALRIPVKLLLQRYTRLMRTASRTTATHADLFPDAVGAVAERRRPSSRSTATPSATIRFAFAGSAPVAPKVTRSDSNVASCMPATFAGAALLNQAQIVCRRRLLRSYTQPQFHRFSVIDYHRMPL